MQLPKALVIYWNRLERHNWMWLLADEPIDYHTGKKNEEALKAVAEKGSKKFSVAFEVWDEWRISMFNASTQKEKKEPKPTLEDLTKRLDDYEAPKEEIETQTEAGTPLDQLVTPKPVNRKKHSPDKPAITINPRRKPPAFWKAARKSK